MCKRLSLAALILCPLFGAAPLPLSFKVADELVPPGGVAQIKFFLTEPKPISKADVSLAFDAGLVDSVLGIALFAPNGDVGGVADYRNGQLHVRLTSPGSTFGMSLDYPILTVAMRLRADALVGSSTLVSMPLDTSAWVDPLGQPYPMEFSPGALTVGGTISIHNILPGGGLVRADQPFRIVGQGFGRDVDVDVNGVGAATILSVSSTEIVASLPLDFTMDAKRVRVRNKKDLKSLDIYYSYLRSVPLGQSANTSLAAVVPLFSTAEFTSAAVGPVKSAGPLWTGLALENAQSQTASVVVDMVSPFNAVLASVAFDLPSGMKISRDVAEFFPAADRNSGYLRVRSSVPVRVLGLVGNDADGNVLAVTPVAF